MFVFYWYKYVFLCIFVFDYMLLSPINSAYPPPDSLVMKFLLRTILIFSILLRFNWHCDALRNLVPFVQFKKCETHPWRSATFNKVADWSCNSNTPPWVFSTSSKLYKWYQIAQRTTYLVHFSGKSFCRNYFAVD